MTAYIYLKTPQMNSTKETDWLNAEVWQSSPFLGGKKRPIWELSTGVKGNAH